jgi:hypothetical protein
MAAEPTGTKFIEYQGDGSYHHLTEAFWMYRLNDHELAPIHSEVYSIKDNFEKYSDRDARRKLAGHLSHEYDLTECNYHVENIVLRELYNWNGFVGGELLGKQQKKFGSEMDLKIESLWVNYMKKTEFNPIHDHTGAYSFVFWLDVPYSIQDERDYYPNANGQLAGVFQFVVPTMRGVDFLNIPVDKTYNGTLCIFPADQMHAVYPFFTSDDYRITVAGNLSYYSKENINV